MIVDRFYYSQLNKQEKAIYKAFYKGAMSHQDIIPIPVTGKISQTIFEKIFLALTRDNPLIYFLNQSACDMAWDMFGHTAICPQYFFSKDKIKEYNRNIEKEVNELVAQLQLAQGSDYDKVLKVHDWLCSYIEYDYGGSDVSNPLRVILAHNIVGVFARQKKAMCEGIAKAAKVLLNAVDVKCIVATGNAQGNGTSGPHAWNIVNIDGKPYHMDVTWDIGARNGEKNRIAYDYFNINDAMILKDHQADTVLPVCDSLVANYFVKNKLVFKTKIQLLAYIEKELRQGRREVYFRLEGKLKPTDVINDIIRLAARCLMGKGRGSVQCQNSPNDATGVCWVKIL